MFQREANKIRAFIRILVFYGTCELKGGKTAAGEKGSKHLKSESVGPGILLNLRSQGEGGLKGGAGKCLLVVKILKASGFKR